MTCPAMTEARDRDPLSATQRAAASREAAKAAIGRELMLVAILTRIWPSHRCAPRKRQKHLPEMVCVHSPAGVLMWRISDQEAPLFEHLALSDNHATAYRAGEKEALLLLLAVEGWQ